MVLRKYKTTDLHQKQETHLHQHLGLIGSHVHADVVIQVCGQVTAEV